MTRSRIDTHHHRVPPFYGDWLDQKGVGAGGLPIPARSPATSLELTDTHDIQTAIVSVSTPGVEPGKLGEAREMARRLNEQAADLVRDHPGRFGFFAGLPPPRCRGGAGGARLRIR